MGQQYASPLGESGWRYSEITKLFQVFPVPPERGEELRLIYLFLR